MPALWGDAGGCRPVGDGRESVGGGTEGTVVQSFSEGITRGLAINWGCVKLPWRTDATAESCRMRPREVAR